MLLFDPHSERWYASDTWRKWHRGRCLGTLFLTLVAAGGYVTEWCITGSLPGGSSLSGGVSGLVAGLLFVYLFLYCCRKVSGFRWLFRRRPTAHYLARHIWLGVLTLPLVVLHAGCLTRWGGPLTTVLLVVYLGVFASGVWGLWVQQRLPQRLLSELPDETIRSQVPALIERQRREAELLVRAACGPPLERRPDVLDDVATGPMIRDARRHRGAGLLRPLPPVQASEAECRTLWKYFHEQVDPYLDKGSASGSRLRLLGRVESDFDDLRSRLHPDLHPLVDALQEVCVHRRQLDEQTRWHDWLHLWIGAHLVLSSALIVLVVWHAVTAVLYW